MTGKKDKIILDFEISLAKTTLENLRGTCDDIVKSTTANADDFTQHGQYGKGFLDGANTALKSLRDHLDSIERILQTTYNSVFGDQDEDKSPSKH